MDKRKPSQVELRAQKKEMREKLDMRQVDKRVHPPVFSVSFGSPALSATLNEININDYLKVAHQGLNINVAQQNDSDL